MKRQSFDITRASACRDRGPSPEAALVVGGEQQCRSVGCSGARCMSRAATRARRSAAANRAVVGRRSATGRPDGSPWRCPAEEDRGEEMFGYPVPRYIVATVITSTSTCPNRRVARATYGPATAMTATTTVRRASGKFGLSWPKRTTASRTPLMLCPARRACPSPRAIAHAATPVIPMSRASRQRRQAAWPIRRARPPRVCRPHTAAGRTTAARTAAC